MLRKPVLERQRTLVDEKRETVCVPASGFCGQCEKGRDRRLIDAVIHQMTWTEAGGGNDRWITGLQTYGRSVDNEIRAQARALQGGIIEGKRGDSDMAAERTETIFKRKHLFGGAIHDGQFLDSLYRTLDGDRPSGSATCAKDDDIEPRELGIEIIGDRADETGAIGVESADEVFIEHHGVHRAEGSCFRMHFATGLKGFEFVRYGHIAAEESEGTHPFEGFEHMAGGDVDADVACVDSEGIERGLVHRWRGGMADRVTDHG